MGEGLDGLLGQLCSERVLLACSEAKAVPGDVWVRGAEGHYAFLCGVAALLELPEVADLIEHARRRRDAQGGVISMQCPDRVLRELGFTPTSTIEQEI